MFKFDGRNYHVVESGNFPLTQPTGDVVLTRAQVEGALAKMQKRLRDPDLPKADRKLYQTKTALYEKGLADLDAAQKET